MVTRNCGGKVLLVSQDAALRDSLSEQFAACEEFTTDAVGDAIAVLDATASGYYDLILIDAAPPELDGRDLSRQIRDQGVGTPIIMLTGEGDDADMILGLDAGASDYVVKPFRVAVLLARMRAHLRHHQLSEDAVFTIGPYSFRPAAKLLVNGEGKHKIRLTEKETAILRYLYRAAGRTVGRDTLLNEVWGYRAGLATHTLETHVYRLRQKIEADPANAVILLTDSGGYRLVP